MTTFSQPTSAEYWLASATDRDRLYLQFDLYRDRFRDAFGRALTRAGVEPSGAWCALDVACGEGLYSADLVDRYPAASVVGFDRDPEAIATACAAFTGRSRLSFHVADVHDALAPVVGEGFDLAFAQFGLTSFRNGASALRRLWEVVRPGGAILLLDATERGFEFPHPSAQALVDAGRAAWPRYGTYAAGDRYELLLADAGFINVTTEPQNYVVGGSSRVGQAHLLNMISLLISMRDALVERTCVISGEDFAAHLASLRAAAKEPSLEGTCWYRLAIATKPK
jgi:ubiquinone/menaquinone biosynthesis C-methylase UbiE